MLDNILLISSGLTRSPEGSVKISEIKKRTGIDIRTLRKWLTAVIITQKYTPIIEPLGKNYIDRKKDAKFMEKPLAWKLLELFYRSHPDGYVKMEETEDAFTASLLQAKLLVAIERRGRQYIKHTDVGHDLAVKLRDLVNNFYETLFDMSWINTIEVEEIAREWEKKLEEIHSEIIKRLHERTTYFPPSKAAKIIAEVIKRQKRTTRELK